MDNMTALVSCFARAYHYRNSNTPVFADSVAEQILMAEEYDAISRNMAQGIGYFAPGFKGTPEEALRFIVNHQLAPSVLARSAFCEQAIGNAVHLGCRQVVICACGYDTFSLRTDNQALTVYELDRPEMIEDRRIRIARARIEPACRVKSIGCDLSKPTWKESLIEAGFDMKRPSFSSLLGIGYYLTEDEFEKLIAGIASLSCEGASICLDYPINEEGRESARNRELAAAAGEAMKARYSYGEMEALLSKAGFLIYEHMDADEVTEAFLKDSGMTAPAGVGYCLAVRKG
ncbi:MAG: class I SAM-dependent methyltransferase [Clostridia bacterium]|nr:class I SAM-dependent methyltransferase [Clostridia bacterium]